MSCQSASALPVLHFLHMQPDFVLRDITDQRLDCLKLSNRLNF